MVRIEFRTDNAAFGETEAERRQEIVRVLREVAHTLERSGASGFTVRDVNGNTIGTYYDTAKPRRS